MEGPSANTKEGFSDEDDHEGEEQEEDGAAMATQEAVLFAEKELVSREYIARGGWVVKASGLGCWVLWVWC